MEKSSTARAYNQLGGILIFVRPHRLVFISQIIFIILNSAITILLADNLKKLINLAIYKKGSNMQEIVIVLLILLAVSIGLNYICKYNEGKFNSLVMQTMNKKLFNHLKDVSVSFIETNRSGDILSRLTNDITVVRNFINSKLPDMIYHPVMIISIFAYLLYINWKLTLVSIIILPVIIILNFAATKSIGKYAGQLQQHYGEANAKVKNTIDGIQILKTYNLEEKIYNNYATVISKILKKSLSIEARFAWVMTLSNVLRIIPTILCTIYGGYMTVKNEITPGDLLAFTYILNIFMTSASELPKLIADMTIALKSSERLMFILSQPTENDTGDSFIINEKDAYVEFNDICFSYDGETDVLSNISFSLYKGKKIALVGVSGSGKSTIFKLLCGFYKPQKGQIKIFGDVINDKNIVESRRHIAYINQDIFLFPGTIYENIKYGRPEASEEEVIKAAEMAYANEFIMKLQKGYESETGECGGKLSGGEKQRIAIARSILKDAPIIIFDEHTSAVDAKSENYIQEAIKNIQKDKAVFVIAHKLSTIMDADEILVMDRGKIVERGTHQTLVSKRGTYWGMCEAQSLYGQDNKKECYV